MEIKVTIGATPELLQAMQALAGLYGGASANAPAPVKKMTASNGAAAPKPLKVEETSGDKVPTIEEVRKKMHEVSEAGKKTECIAALKKLGAAKLSELAEDKRQAFLTKLEELA